MHPTLCSCRKCLVERDERIHGIPAHLAMIVVCPECGNKQCPKTKNHTNLYATKKSNTHQGSIDLLAPDQRELISLRARVAGLEAAIREALKHDLPNPTRHALSTALNPK